MTWMIFSQEYLASRSALPMYQIVTHKAHAEAVQMSMRYISVFLKQEPSHGNLELWSCFPMLAYVFSSGFDHLAYVDSESPVALEALQSLGSDVRHHPSHWDRLCELREDILEWPYAPWPSSKHGFALYILIAYSPPGLLRTFLSNSHSSQPRIRTNPLVYAADLRKTEHAIVLLACGADVDARGLVIDDSYRASPLEVAIDLGDDVLVGELLQRGCLVTSELLATAVCMPWCSTRVLVKLLQTDEFAEWVLGIGDERLYRGIFNSARPNAGDNRKTDEDHVSLARRLSQLGLDLSPDCQFGKGLIERALHAAHTSMLEFLLSPHQPPPAEFLISASTGDTSETVPVVRFLLQRGVNVHAVSDGGDNALHLAAMCPWEPRSLELTKLLIHAGCNPHILNSDDEAPLVVAVRHGHCSVVELFLSCNVPLPSNILHLALERRRNSQMIEFLLHRGADVHAVARSSGNTILHCAIAGSMLYRHEQNDRERQELECFGLVKRFLKVCDPTTRNFTGKTALEIAMQRNFTSVVELLLSPDVPLSPDTLPIAVWRGSTLEMVEGLIQRGADVCSITSSGDTALHFAISEYDADEETRCTLVKRLINAGCDTTALNSTRKTALEIAMRHNLTSVVELLLSPDVPLSPDALPIAVWHGSTLEMVEGLIQRGADVRSIASSGDTALHFAISQYNSDEDTRCKLVKRLINAGCNPIALNSNRETTLEITIRHNFTSVIKLLLPFSPDALLIAIQHGHPLEMVESLIQGGADVRSTMSSGDTALHLAISQYDADEETRCKLVKRLINAGCNSTALNSSRKTALEIAEQRNFTSVIKLLLPLSPDALLIAIRRGSTLEMIEGLIQGGADVHSTTSSGDTALHFAARRYFADEETCYKLVKRLIGAGCDTTALNSTRETVLGIAMHYRLTSVIDLLLSPDVPPSPDALPIAVQRGSTLEMIEGLIQRGANVHSTTSCEGTALHVAVGEYVADEETHYKLVKTLIDAGCDTAALDINGETVLEIALHYHFTSVFDLLLSPDVPLSLDALPIAVWRGSTLEMIEDLSHSERCWCAFYHIQREYCTSRRSLQIWCR